MYFILWLLGFWALGLSQQSTGAVRAHCAAGDGWDGLWQHRRVGGEGWCLHEASTCHLVLGMLPATGLCWLLPRSPPVLSTYELSTATLG